MGQLVRDVILRDGSVLRLRAPEPEDEPAIKDFFDRLDPESRYLRFHGHVRSDRVAAHYAAADGESRVALLAHREGEIVAVAGYERLRELGAAEVAFAVLASEQGNGLGTRMLEQLAAHAAEHGIDRFDASVMAENRRMLGVFSSAGFAVKRTASHGIVELSLDIRPTETLAQRIAERDHLATVASLRPLLAPGSVAVVGASNAPGSVGGTIFANLLGSGFKGIATPVNRQAKVVHSVRAYPRVSDIPETPDVAVLAVPAAAGRAGARAAAGAGVRGLIVVSAGFAERDEEGRRRQDALLDLARDHGIRLIGPNSLGVLSTDPAVSLNATLGTLRPKPGRLAISSQSGALGIALLGQAIGRGLGVASFVTLGNRADVSTNDLLEWWEEDDHVAAIALYMESFGNPRRFSTLSRRVSRRKPIVAVKGHRDGAVADVEGSSTGRALRGEAVFDALFRQAGVLRVEGAQALFDAAALLERQPLPAGRRVAVVTNSGGLGTLAADACLSRGLTIAPLAGATSAAIAAAVPHADRTTNPVDLGISATPEDMRAALAAVLADEGVDAAIVLSVDLAGVSPDEMLAALEPEPAPQSDGVPDPPARTKPVAASVVRADGRMAEARGTVPNFRFPEACAQVLALAADRRDWLSRPMGQRPSIPGLDAEAARRRVLDALDGAGSDDLWLGPEDVSALLAAYGIAELPQRRCADAGEAVAAAAAVDGPVVVKALLPPPAQAYEVDALLLGLEGETAVRAGWEALRDRVGAAGREWQGASVQALAAAGVDVLVGAVNHRDLGVVTGVGVGGRHAGLPGDVAFRLAPSTDVDAEELIGESPVVSTWLRRPRAGMPPPSGAALAAVVLRLTRMFEDVPELLEGDLNPLRVTADGAIVLDARLRAGRRPAPQRIRTW
ncbi:MAG: GNAT family N-acetyltransferase [Solirubrobacteraceae bacterium]|nr:GNAT family N-acetyltransferase [Solirubrobacteraceae bacterium]